MGDIKHLARIAVIDDEKPEEWSPWGEPLSCLDLTELKPPIPNPAQAWDRIRLNLIFERPSALKEKRSDELKHLAGFVVDGISPRNNKEKEEMITNTVRGISNNLGAYSKNNNAICKKIGISLTVLVEHDVEGWRTYFMDKIKQCIERGSGIKVDARFSPIMNKSTPSKRVFIFNKKTVLQEMINRYKSNDSTGL